VKTAVMAVSSNAVVGQAKPETVSATPFKACENLLSKKLTQQHLIMYIMLYLTV
jgi:hypothetical protein